MCTGVVLGHPQNSVGWMHTGTGTLSKQCWVDAHQYWDTPTPKTELGMGGCALVLGHPPELGGCALVLGHPQNSVGWMRTGTGTPSKQNWVDAHWYWDTLKTELGGCTLVLGHSQNSVGWMRTSTGTPPSPKQSWAWVDVHWYWDTLKTKEGADHISGWWVFQCLTILG